MSYPNLTPEMQKDINKNININRVVERELARKAITQGERNKTQSRDKFSRRSQYKAKDPNAENNPFYSELGGRKKSRTRRIKKLRKARRNKY